ncbi:restriction endonuclease subunit S [Rosenbergiella nectarea]|uniref:restriction endonuclease subunit S n=1 Tax=Rosenbergiella nectarea TaxID=988801 RepID=UPI001BDAEDD1|nr:restriction endonuclease subunit S [Rosenbergiella nectarea]MBT0730150.1 restriction endonuclease subunit S [Rosenbergiella nectarea subsp. apis]
MNNWAITSLEGKISIKHGYPFKSEFFSDIETSFIVLTPGNFYEEGGFKRQVGKEKFYTGEVPEKYLHEAGDLIVAMTEQAAGLLGSCARVPESGIYLHNQRLGLITTDPSKILKDYVYHLFKTKTVREQVRLTSSGSKVKHTSPERIYNVKIPLPSVTEQQKIVNFLDALENKIDLNNRINAELEAMAKTLYDYWFVQFDFPNENGKPYKASGGKMVYNDNLKREIPEGWSASNILSVANLLGGGTPSKSKEEYWNGHIPFFTPSDSDNNVFSIETESYITDLGLEKSSTRLFEKNTVFITARGSVGRLALNSVPMAMNQSCYALKPKNGISFSFLFYLIKELIHHLEVKASGSVFNSIVSNDIEFTNLALPDDKTIIERFAEMAEPIFKRIEIATLENKQLSSQRDWLLPMLMNGQVTVKHKTASQEAQHG